MIAFGVLLLMAVAANYVMFQHRVPDTLNGADTARLVAEDLQARRGLSTPPDVTCPSREPLRAGVSFTCDLTGPGGPETLRVTETNGRGRLVVAPGRPSRRWP